MDNSPPRAASQVFVPGFESFEIVYLTANKQVVSHFQGAKNYSWTSEGTPEDGTTTQ